MTRLRQDRQLGNFAYHTLSMRDQLEMESETFPNFPLETRSPDRIRTLAEARQCYEENREAFLSPKNRQNPAGFHPGSRCWGFWAFDQALREPPKEQVLRLHELHLLCQAERRELAEWLRIYPHRYSQRERALIESWHDRSPAGGAEVREFRADDESD